ncbi:protein Tob1-like [Limulus polyphemus]|uniref:Protein Tob1-like n=1 Tax=Limulus polyphemus TaxID=6850 RepID=A0ABM1BV13_LIMPO|nr:protein Tob1-like [Limulus polyphemus]
MHVEVQVALNFLISFLYNKLPRRRVNQFGEELEKALRRKFQGHWYPDKPMKGSAYRCLKTSFPLDPIFEEATLECGVDLRDIQENLPKELSIWIDPGEVSYRLGEKGPVKGLYSQYDNSETTNERVMSRTFNPEAQCFKPIDSVASQLEGLSLSCSPTTPVTPYRSTPSPKYKPNSPVSGFISKTTTPLTFTTATFAQTKFGSTKLKSNTKRSHRLSPTEFGNSIKQRVMMQQVQQLAQQQQHLVSSHPQSAVIAAAILATEGNANINVPQRPRSLSPNPQLDASFLLMASLQQSRFSPNSTQLSSRAFPHSGLVDINLNGYTNDLFAASNINAAVSTAPVSCTAKTDCQSISTPTNMAAINSTLSSFFDKSYVNTAGGLNINLPSGDSNTTTFGVDTVNLNLSGMSYANQYQHLLVAN